VDAREQLRRYLEQRREMGETELVLDGMSVDDVLRIVGGKSQAGSAKREASSFERATTELREPREQREAPASRAADAPRETVVGEVDWRAALRATGAGPGTPKSAATTTSPAAPMPSNAVPPAPTSRDTLPADRVLQPAGNDTLDAIAKEVASCTKCPLHATATNPVPGEGNPNADLMCVGEAPGATEDETGRPFVGAAGQLLTKILAAINLPREEVFICNVLKHRPPGNRNPAPDEVTACSPYLVRQIQIVQPKVIIAWGTFAAQTLLDTKLSIGKLRGQVHRYYGVPLIVTYHPAALLRNPAWKRPTWEDVQLARRILDSPSAGA
jgi:uracil-DNA glycosylase family 4